MWQEMQYVSIELGHAVRFGAYAMMRHAFLTNCNTLYGCG